MKTNAERIREAVAEALNAHRAGRAYEAACAAHRIRALQRREAEDTLDHLVQEAAPELDRLAREGAEGLNTAMRDFEAAERHRAEEERRAAERALNRVSATSGGKPLEAVLDLILKAYPERGRP